MQKNNLYEFIFEKQIQAPKKLNEKTICQLQFKYVDNHKPFKFKNTKSKYITLNRNPKYNSN